MAHFTWLDYTVFVLYLLATAAIGAAFMKGQRNLDEYFLAGRSMGSVIVAMTVLAALFSGISFLASPSEGYANGPVFYLINVSFFIATPVTALIFLPFFYKSRFFTAYQYLEERFSVQIRTLASASFILRVLLWLAAATYAPALALEQVTGMPLWFTILVTGAVTTIYTTFGGMKAGEVAVPAADLVKANASGPSAFGGASGGSGGVAGGGFPGTGCDDPVGAADPVGDLLRPPGPLRLPPQA